MDEIAAKSKTKSEVVQESREWLLLVLEQLLSSKDAIAFELRKGLVADSVMAKCNKPECAGNLVVRYGKTKKRFLGCTEYPKCTNTFPLPQKGRLIPLNRSCETCGSPMIKLVVRSAFDMCVNMNCATKDEWKKKQAEKLAPAQKLENAAPKPAKKQLPLKPKKTSNSKTQN